MRILASLVAASAILAVSPPALACSCRVLTPEEHAAETALIFLGTAKQTVNSDEEGSETVYTIFTVKEMLKGDGKAGDELYVFHPADLGGNCGVNFKDGTEMLVLADNPPADDAPPTTNLCVMAGDDEAGIRAALKKAKP